MGAAAVAILAALYQRVWRPSQEPEFSPAPVAGARPSADPLPRRAPASPGSAEARREQEAPPPPQEFSGDVLETLRGRHLLIPVDGIRSTDLRPGFSQARGERTHEALDIIASRGTPVRAVEAGTIAKLFTSKAGGLTIYQFDPGRQFAYYYAHLDRYAEGIEEGRTVARGDLLAYVGTTGNASPDAPHLHFGIALLGQEKRWWGGTPIDPYLVWKSGDSEATTPDRHP